MSHPNPNHDSDNVRTDDSPRAKKSAIARRMGDGKVKKDSSPFGKLKAMMDDKPSGIQGHMDWFKKHGTPKNTSVTKRF